MSEAWQEETCWSDPCIPHIQPLLGLACLPGADVDEDQREQTDLTCAVGWQAAARWRIIVTDRLHGENHYGRFHRLERQTSPG